MAAARHDPLGRDGFRRAAAALPFEDRARTYGLRPPPPPPGDLDTDPPLEPPTDSPAIGDGSPPTAVVSPRQPVDLDGIGAAEASLARSARNAWPALPAADVAAAVDAGVMTQAREARAKTNTGEADVGNHPPDLEIGDVGDQDGGAGRMAAAVGTAAAAMLRQGLSPAATEPVDWTGFGTVIPVLAGSPGTGASVLATVIADVAQMAHQRVLLVDPADPSRSGLTAAVRSRGPWLTHPTDDVRIRFSWRAQAVLAQLETDLPVIAPGMVPPPRFWRPPAGSPQITVVDLGHDPWRVAAHPLTGAGAWLRRGDPIPRPVLVVRPTRPSLLHAEQVLARLETWVAPGVVAPVAQLVVMGAKRWPTGVAGAAGRRVAGLLAEAVFVPNDADICTAGITASVTPARLRQPVTSVLRRWDLIAGPGARRVTTRWSR